MSKIIKIGESQANKVFALQESSGVNDVMFKVADLITRQIAFKDIFEILSNIRLIEHWHEEYDDTYDNEVEYEGKTYRYDLFYEPGNGNGIRHGETDGDTVSVNFYLIEGVIAEYNEMKRIGDNRYSFDEEDDYFNAYEYSKEALYGCPGVEYDIYKVVYPIVLHELTHTLNSDADPMGRLWIKSVNRYTEEDVRDFMYLFSTSEMNSRVASASAILISLIKLEYSESDIEQVRAFDAKNTFFTEDLMPKVLKNDELKYGYMNTLVKSLESNSIHSPVSKEYLESCMLKPVSSVYSLAFQLAINEDKLYKRSNPRQVLKLYASNPEQFEQKIVSFYKNLLEHYKRRIYKVCWYTYNNYQWDTKELDDDYENNVRDWHNKIWSEN